MSEESKIGQPKKPSRIKWLIPISLLIIFLGGIYYSRGSGPLAIKEIPTLAPLDQNHESVLAPDVELTDLSGKQVKLRDFRGKAVLVNFWSLTCPACMMELKSLESLSQQLSGKPFALLAITDDSRDDVKEFLDRSGMKLPVYFDQNSEAARKYEVAYLPVSYVIAPDGKVVDKVAGAADWSDPQVITYFQKLLEISQAKKPTP